MGFAHAFDPRFGYLTALFLCGILSEGSEVGRAQGGGLGGMRCFLFDFGLFDF